MSAIARPLALCLLLFSSLAARPAAAAAAVLEVSEVHFGTPASPTAQYVVLRMKVPGSVAGKTLVYLDGSGIEKGRTRFNHEAVTTGTGVPVLVANGTAASFFGVQPDFDLTGQGLVREGAICVLNLSYDQSAPHDPAGRDDCLVYGIGGAQATPYIDSTNVTVNAFSAATHAGGLPTGAVIRRVRSTNSPPPGETIDSASDFALFYAPWPQNSRGVVGVLAGSTCGNSLIEGGEGCDNGSSNGNDGACTTTCRAISGVACGNGVRDAGEQCDDGNLVDGDGCSSVCQLEPIFLGRTTNCGNGVLEVGEGCDPPGSTCTSGCQMASNASPSCGNGIVEAGEQCDLGGQNGAGAACSATCFWEPTVHAPATCGNAVVEPGETCDDGNLAAGDGCGATCRLEVTALFACGNSVVEPGEACDAGSATAACTASCTFVTPPVDPPPAGTTVVGGTFTTTAGSGIYPSDGPADGGTGSVPDPTGGVHLESGTSPGGTFTGGAVTEADPGPPLSCHAAPLAAPALLALAALVLERRRYGRPSRR